MKTNSHIQTGSLLTGLIFMITCCSTEPDMENEEQQIRVLWDNASKYVCSGDWENYARCWAHSPKIQVIHTDQGEWLTGWEKVKAKYEALLASGMKCDFPKNDLTLNISMSGDMAWGTADIALRFNDSTQTQIRLWETAVFEKFNGEWKMVMGMASVPKIRP